MEVIARWKEENDERPRSGSCEGEHEPYSWHGDSEYESDGENAEGLKSDSQLRRIVVVWEDGVVNGLSHRETDDGITETCMKKIE